jgi:WD40 repeat protein
MVLKNEDDVGVLAFSPDGKRLAAGSVRNRVSVWNIAAGRIERILSAPGTGMNSLSFSADGKRLAAANNAGKVHLWQLPLTGMGPFHPTRTLALGPAGGTVSRAFFTPDSRHLITVNGNGTLYILRLEKFQDDE